MASWLLVFENTLNLLEQFPAPLVNLLATLNPAFPGQRPSTLIRCFIHRAVRYEG
jgi:hypothetical protein